MTDFLLRSHHRGYWSAEKGWMPEPVSATRMTVDEALLASERVRAEAGDVAVVRVEADEGPL